MEIALIKEGVVVNRVMVNSVEMAQAIFPGYTAIEDNSRSYNIGDNYQN
jgi:hypothetical protein